MASRCSTRAGIDARALEAGLAEHGVELTDVRHLMLSHVHLDHAGGAGTLVRRHPELTVWVSEIGYPPPRRPIAARAVGAPPLRRPFDPLWGELAPVPEANARIADGRCSAGTCSRRRGTHRTTSVTPAKGRSSPATQRASGCRARRTCCRSRLRPTSTSRRGYASIDAIRAREPERLALIHFGVYEDVAAHLDRLSVELDRWSERVGDGMGQEAFVEAARADAGEDADVYDRVAPIWQSWFGMKRYWEKRREAE